MLVEHGADIFGLVIDGRVKACDLGQPAALVLAARDADHAAALDLGDLPDHRADRAGRRRDDHRLACLRLGNVHQPEIRRHPGCAERTHIGRQRNARQPRHLRQRRARQRVVDRPAGETRVDDVARREAVEPALGHHAQPAAAHRIADLHRRQVGIHVAHPDPVRRIERQVDRLGAHLPVLERRQRALDQLQIPLAQIPHRPLAQHPGQVLFIDHAVLPISLPGRLDGNPLSARRRGLIASRHRPSGRTR